MKLLSWFKYTFFNILGSIFLLQCLQKKDLICMRIKLLKWSTYRPHFEWLRLLNPKELHLSKMFTFQEISKGNKNLKTWDILNALRWILLQLSLTRLDQVMKSPEKSLPTLLANIACEGKLKQNSTVCLKEITVNRI